MKKISIVLTIIIMFISLSVFAGVDRASYDKVKTGMTIQQVESLLGEGAKDMESETNGVSMEMYSWGNILTGKYISITFMGGKVFSKTATGL